uniref:Uncharacterized protein n=1 Tax=Vitis vinifera TaxID=29760 RepID=A5BBW6_VITVI|nr:hypothetical protein VITISV_021528 [Vitis vinifera]
MANKIVATKVEQMKPLKVQILLRACSGKDPNTPAELGSPWRMGYGKWFASASFMASQFCKYSDGESPINSLSERSMMHNLGNLKLVCLLPIAPWNLLDRKIRACSCRRAPNQKERYR